MARPAAFTTLILTAALALGTLATATPADAELTSAEIVPVAVKVTDANGVALAGVPLQSQSTQVGSTLTSRFKTNRNGLGHFDAFAGVPAQLRLREGGFSSPGFRHHRIVGGTLRDTTTRASAPIAVDVTSDMDRIDLTLPELATYTLRVVTAAGQPVNEVPFSPLALLSAPVTNGPQEHRIMQGTGYGLLTNFRGKAKITTYALEPDPEVTTLFKPLLDRDGDGQLDGVLGSYAPRPGTNVDWWVSYQDWAAQPTTTVVVPYVPVVSGANSKPGRQPGTATVRARVMQPSADGTTKPIRNRRATLYRPPTASKKGLSFGSVRTNRRGYAVFRDIKLKRAARLVVGFESTHVADTLRAVPR